MKEKNYKELINIVVNDKKLRNKRNKQRGKNKINKKRFFSWDIETSKFTPVNEDGRELLFEEFKNYDNTFSRIPSKRKCTVMYLSNICEVDFSRDNNKFNTPMMEETSTFHYTMNEVVNYFYELNNELECNNEKGIIYSHNLNFENSWLKNVIGAKHIVISESLIRNRTDEVKIVYDCLPNLEFRCSLALLNLPVSKLGEELGEDFNKLDYDYSKIRIPGVTEITQHDKDYNHRDVVIPMMHIWNNIQKGVYDIDSIPLTFTSVVRREERKFLETIETLDRTIESDELKDKLGKSFKSLKIDRQKTIAEENFINDEINLYRGGLTGCSIDNLGKVIKAEYKNGEYTGGVFSFDFKSHYPSMLVRKYFPVYFKNSTAKYEGEYAQELLDDIMGECLNAILNGENFMTGLKNITDNTYDDEGNLIKRISIKGFRAKVKFRNIRVKEKYKNIVLPLTHVKDKTNYSGLNFNSDEKFDKLNGKFISADWYECIVNQTDLENIINIYDFDDIECKLIYTTTAGRFLRFRPIFVLDKFLEKECNESGSVKYNLSKQCVNGIYGCFVMNPIQPLYFYNDELEIDEISYLKMFYDGDDKYNNILKHTLYNHFYDEYYNNEGINIYGDGVQITSYARKELCDIMRKFVDLGGENHDIEVIYSDTDSAKIWIKNKKGIMKVMKFVKDYNNSVIEGNKKHPAFRKFYRMKKPDINDKEFNNLKGSEKKKKFNKELKKFMKGYSKIIRLGILECENSEIYNENNKESIGYKPYEIFCTYGAKKYCYVDKDKINTVVAGCSKELGKSMTEYAIRNNLSYETVIRTVFRHNIYYTPNISGRTTAFRNSEIDKLYNQDLYCKVEGIDKPVKVDTKGGMYIENVTYKLSISQEDLKSKFICSNVEAEILGETDSYIFDGYNLISPKNSDYGKRIDSINKGTYEDDYLNNEM